jgi:putative flavoprotein involved in K+ transport
VERNPQGADFMISTTDGIFLADNVVVASGTYQEPRIPAFSKNLSEQFVQLHTNEYRNPSFLPDGAVLVVGTGQSGCQIAEEIYQSGRKVYLCVGGANRIPRRYRGKDSIYWLEKMDFFDQKADSLENSKERFKANPYVSGKNGGHSLNLHQFACDGVTLLGHMKGAQGGEIYLVPDLKENLAKIDQFVVELKQGIDQYIEKHNIDAEDAPVKPVLKDGYESENITQMDLHAEGIQTVIWATGYKFDFSWVEFPIFDQDGYPIQDRGVSEYPGLYFVGLHFLYKRKSGLLLGVAEIANHVAEDIALRT